MKSLSNELSGKHKKTSVYGRYFALISDDVVTIRKLMNLPIENTYMYQSKAENIQ